MTFDNTDSDSETNVASSSECESFPNVDELPFKEEIRGIDVPEEESRNEENCGTVDQNSDDIFQKMKIYYE